MTQRLDNLLSAVMLIRQTCDGEAKEIARRAIAKDNEIGAGNQTQPTKLERLLALYQDKLVDAIKDKRHTGEERFGLQMAGALFRGALEELEIPNV